MEDALLLGSMLLTLIRNCDRVKIACLTQPVNVAAPIMTVNGGPAWAQTIYYPFVHASRYAKRSAPMTKVNCETYDAGRMGTVPSLDCAAVLSGDGRELKIFAVNRLRETVDLEISLRDFAGFDFKEHLIMEDKDPDAANTAQEPYRVVPRAGGNAGIREGSAAVRLGGYSWNVIRFGKEDGT